MNADAGVMMTKEDLHQSGKIHLQPQPKYCDKVNLSLCCIPSNAGSCVNNKLFFTIHNSSIVS